MIKKLIQRIIVRHNTRRSDKLFRIISKQCEPEGGYKKKILFGYSFSIFDCCKYHDFFLAQSLKSRGAKIVPLICGGTQEVECSVYGGYWGNDEQTREEKIEKHRQNCRNCIRSDRGIWEKWSGENVLYACNYLTDEDKQKAKEYVDGLDFLEYTDWKYDGYYPIGIWSFREYCNSYLVSALSFEKTEEEIIKQRAYNEILMIIASERCIAEENPDIIYSNDSFYSPYCILEYIAKKRGIPFYNAYSYAKGTYSYAKDTPSMSMPLQHAWDSFQNHVLTNEENEQLDQYLRDRRSGKPLYINTAGKGDSIISDEKVRLLERLNNGHPTALVASNVSWDGSSLDKCIAFSSIDEWIRETALFFANHEKWNVIFKAHPAEKHKLLPEAREQIGIILADQFPNGLPNNIMVLTGDSQVTVYDLLPYIALGIVHTSTVGCELPIEGIPVILEGLAPIRGKGICIEPQDKADYFQAITNCLSKSLTEKEKENLRNRARKYFYLYQFKYFTPTKLFYFDWQEGINSFVTSADQLKRGFDVTWDYICDSIFEGREIFDADRIPPT